MNYFSVFFFDNNFLTFIHINVIEVTFGFNSRFAVDVLGYVLPVSEPKFFNTFKQKELLEGSPRVAVEGKVEFVNDAVVCFGCFEAQETEVMVVSKNFCVLSDVFVALVAVHLARGMMDVLKVKGLRNKCPQSPMSC